MTTPADDLPTADARGRLVATAPDVVPPPVPEVITTRPLVVTSPLPNNLLLRRPDAARSEHERQLVEGHQVARRDAIERLAGWLADLPIDTLAERPGELGPTEVDVDQTLLGQLDVLDLADRLLAEHNMAMPKLVVARDGSTEHQVPPPAAVAAPVGRFDHPHAVAGPVALLLAEQGTVIVHAVHHHHERLADVTEALAVALGTQVGANLYLSRADAPGFGPHWDDHDVLIVQGLGAKQWEVFEPTEPSALRPVVDEAVGESLAWKGTLVPGHALYVPRGWGHRVSGDDDLSIHLTITLQRLRYDQVASFTAGLAGFWPLFRADVPFDRQQRVVSYAGSLYEEPGQFGAAVAQLGAASALEHGAAQWRAKLPPRRRGRLSAAIGATRRNDWSDVIVQGSFPGGVAVVDEKADIRLVATGPDDPDDRDDHEPPGTAADERVRPLVAAGGQLIELDEWALPALARLLDGRPARVAELPLDDLPPSATLPPGRDPRSLLVAALVGQGVVDVVSAP